jgi:hypothetical protein
MEFIAKIMRLIGQLLLPMFFRPRQFAGLVGILHALIVIAIVVGLRYLQDYLQLTRKLDSGPEWVRENWLPILFLLTYLLLWFGVWLWSLFRIGEEPADHPDLDAAWSEAMAALTRSGIGLGDTPIYLVLGRLNGDEAALFGAGPPLSVNGAPGSGAPLRVYAHREAVYITCPGASLLGRQADLLSGPGDGGGAPLAFTESMSPVDVEKSIGMSMAGGGMLQDIQQIIRKARSENRSLTPDEHRMIRELSGMAGGGQPRPAESRSSHPSVLKNADEADAISSRLRYLCRLISRSRWPLCPLNGVVVLVSMNATDTDEDAQQYGLASVRDLQSVREAGRLYCPVYTLVGDMEHVAGAGEFFAQFPVEKRRQRLGKGFPLVPSVQSDAVVNTIESSIRWIADSLIPFWIFKMFRVEGPHTPPAEAVACNTQLFHFLTDWRERAPRLSRLIARGVVIDLDAPPLFGGCYLAGATEGAERPFCPGFWKRLDETQGSVAWTKEAFAADAQYRGRTQFGYAALAIAAAIVAGLGAYVALFRRD